MGYVALENPRTGEYGVLRRPAGTAGDATIADLYARPGAAGRACCRAPSSPAISTTSTA